MQTMHTLTQTHHRTGAFVQGAFIDAISSEAALQKTARWAARHQSRYLCFCNVYSVVSMHQDDALAEAITHADLAVPDGMPVAWMLRSSGFSSQQRIDGPDFMSDYCAQAERRGEPVFFYGSTPQTLAAIQHWVDSTFPKLKVAGKRSPPFRNLSPEEDEDIVTQINASGARVVFVGLGCPKQELWMAAHRGRINAVMIGVGAAFDYHAGTLKRAPPWMQEHGLEWLYRVCKEPRRLWKRYLVSNTLFILGAMRQLISHRQKA